VDACPVDCIHPRKNQEVEFAQEPQLYIDPLECIDCGACVPVCPVSAIFALDDLPKKWEQYAQINADHYTNMKEEHRDQGETCLRSRSPERHQV
jgi:ferredoxin